MWPNNALQRRPRSAVLINIGISHAAPLNAGVGRRFAMPAERNCHASRIHLKREMPPSLRAVISARRDSEVPSWRNTAARQQACVAVSSHRRVNVAMGDSSTASRLCKVRKRRPTTACTGARAASGSSFTNATARAR
jgi:hypothetical protein